jgi:hypothetical protein
MAEESFAQRVSVQKEHDCFEDLDVDDTIIVKRIVNKQDRTAWLDARGSGQGQMAGSCKHSNEPLDFIKCGEFIA